MPRICKEQLESFVKRCKSPRLRIRRYPVYESLTCFGPFQISVKFVYKTLRGPCVNSPKYYSFLFRGQAVVRCIGKYIADCHSGCLVDSCQLVVHFGWLSLGLSDRANARPTCRWISADFQSLPLFQSSRTSIRVNVGTTQRWIPAVVPGPVVSLVCILTVGL